MIYAAVFGAGMFVGGWIGPMEETPAPCTLVGLLILIGTGFLYVGKTYL